VIYFGIFSTEMFKDLDCDSLETEEILKKLYADVIVSLDL